MNSTQGLDLGLNTAVVFLVLFLIVLAAQMDIAYAKAHEGEPAPVEVSVESGAFIIDGLTLDQEGAIAYLKQRCAQTIPPSVFLNFDADRTLLAEAQRIEKIFRDAAIVCPIGY
ncbi:MAG TPA: hypothetical protein P5077_02180 [bacterium]|nr:hypothetical protein [bacterium]